jgi:Na+/proline symporter
MPFIHATAIVLTLFHQAGDREMLWILRITVLVIAALAAVIALTVGSVYYLS